MSQEGEGRENFLWETQAWAFSNSDNSDGTAGDRADKTSEKSPPESRSNSPVNVVALEGSKRLKDNVKKSKNSGKRCEDKGSTGVVRESDHEIHIWTERERRKKMRNMFANLHALLPQLPAKADKSTIVDEAVNSIKTLQLALQKLQKQKLERIQGAILDEPLLPPAAPQAHSLALESSSREAFMADQGKNWSTHMTSSMAISMTPFPQCYQTWTSPNVVMSVTGDDAHINICATKKPGLLSAIAYVLEKYKLEVVSAHVSSDCFKSMFMLHAHANGVSDQFPEMLPVEEIFKLAVGEIMLWIS